MADYGFRVYGENGSIQFSNNIKNICLAAKGEATAYTPYINPVGPRRYWEITYEGTGLIVPVCAISSSLGLTPFGRTNVGNVYTWGFLSSGNVDSFTYYIFDEIDTNPSGYGIVVYANDGSIAYHSSRLPLRIAPPIITTPMGFRTWNTAPAADIGPISETWPLPAGRDYAVIFGTVAHYWTYMYLGGGNYYYGSNSVAARVVGNSIVTGGLWTSRDSGPSTPNPAFEVYNRQRTIIPIDVTHY